MAIHLGIRVQLHGTFPFLIILIAFVFKITGVSLISYIILAGIKFLSLALSFYFILKVLSIDNDRRKIITLYLIFCFYFLFSPSQNLVMVCDLWIITLLVSAFLFSSEGFQKADTNRKFYLLILVFFFAPLVSPPFALGFIFIITITVLGVIFLRGPKNRMVKRLFPYSDNNIPDYTKKILLRYSTLIGVFIISILIWSGRNYYVFKKFIPSKSNMWFEFYITNVVDSDGQLSLSTSYLSHPVACLDLVSEIRKEGEINWLEHYHEKSKNYLKNEFDDYISNVKNRLFNAFIYIENDMDFIESEKITKFNDSDKLILENAKLIIENGWISVFYSEKQFKTLLNQLGIEEKENVYSDWWNAKQAYLKKKYSLPNFVRSTFMSLIPLLSIISLIVIKKTRKSRIILYSIVLYFVYLIPYILISHQIRYQRPLFILQVIFLFFLITFIVEKVKLFNTPKRNR